MTQCAVWSSLSAKEFDNAKEGMEKLVMSRLYNSTFPPVSAPPNSDDLHKDIVLKQKIDILSWISEDHLEIPKTDMNDRFLSLAKQELLKINTYRAPRDKIICILNCCKVIFGLLRHAGKDESADVFLPTLIFVILRANPQNLVSNMQYIYRFRTPEKLKGEAEYYLSSMTGGIAFIENLDRSSLAISQEDFDRNVETSLSLLHLQQQQEESKPQLKPLLTLSSALKANISKPLGQLTRLLSDENLPDSPPQSSKHSSSFPRRHESTKKDKSTAIEFHTNDSIHADDTFPGASLHQSQTLDPQNIVHQLSFMFPELNIDIIEAVYHSKAGKIDNIIDALLNMS